MSHKPNESPEFKASPAQIGNARGFRIATAFFREHPDFTEGSYQASYLGEGVVLLRRGEASPSEEGADVDPVMTAYLAWTERAMTREPGLLRTMTTREFDLAAGLVEDVEVDIDEDRLPDSFDLP